MKIKNSELTKTDAERILQEVFRRCNHPSSSLYEAELRLQEHKRKMKGRMPA